MLERKISHGVTLFFLVRCKNDKFLINIQSIFINKSKLLELEGLKISIKIQRMILYFLR